MYVGSSSKEVCTSLSLDGYAKKVEDLLEDILFPEQLLSVPVHQSLLSEGVGTLKPSRVLFADHKEYDVLK